MESTTKTAKTAPGVESAVKFIGPLLVALEVALTGNPFLRVCNACGFRGYRAKVGYNGPRVQRLLALGCDARVGR